MSSALLIPADLASRLGWRPRHAQETVPTGVAEVDRLIGGLPRGAVTEIFGPASSGRTSLLVSILAEAVARQENLEVNDAEINAEIETMAAAYPGEGGTTVRRAMEDAGGREGLRARLLERKALDFLYQQARITDAYNLITPA